MGAKVIEVVVLDCSKSSGSSSGNRERTRQAVDARPFSILPHAPMHDGLISNTQATAWSGKIDPQPGSTPQPGSASRCVYVCTCRHVCMRPRVNVGRLVCKLACMHARTYAHACVRVGVYVHMRARVYACVI